jgi:uncharacterized protein YcbK (DUF882 family)
MLRLENLNKVMREVKQEKFHKMSVNERFDMVNNRLENRLDRVAVQSGGLNL